MDLGKFKVKKLEELALKTDQAQKLMEKCVETAQKACWQSCPNLEKSSKDRLVAELSFALFQYYLSRNVDPSSIDYSAKAEELR